LHQPIQRHQQKRRQETNVFGKEVSLSAPKSCSHLPECSNRKENANHIAKPGTLQINVYNELSHIKVYLQYTLVEYSINAHSSPSSEATGGDLLAFLVSLSDIH